MDIPSLTPEIEKLLGKGASPRRTVRQTARETIIQCVPTPLERDVLVHFLTDLSPNSRTHIEFETSQLAKHTAQHVPEVVQSSFDGSKATIVTAWTPGIPIDEYVRSQPRSLEADLRIGIGLFRSLEELESLGLQHLDVSARNLIVMPDGSSRLIRSSYLPPADDAEKLAAAFCSSPEKSGAIDRDTNAASDLYSAGALFFFALTGGYPYDGESISSVLLAHMTNQVPRPSQTIPDLPAVLDEIVIKLLQKDPTNRYQTAAAVLHDLNRVAEGIRRGIVPSFPIAIEDRRDSVVEPALVGRQTELANFQEMLELPSFGKNGLAFLEGISGSGKTRVLLDFSRLAVEKGWNVFRGQCVQEASRQSLTAMRGIIERFAELAQTPEFTAYFNATFDGDWGDLKHFFPDLDLPASEIDSPTWISEQRTLRTLSSFLNAIGTPSRPALVVLDDCQWADELTIKLITHWWKRHHGTDNNLILLLVFRSDEVGSTDAIRLLTPSRSFQLGELSREDVCELAKSMAGNLPRPVLEFVVRVAHGSPFMASAAVRGLVESGAITRGKLGWHVDQEEFEKCLSSSQAGEFLTRRLELLDAETIELLSAAAVLGKEFEVVTAAHLANHSPKSAIEKINEARDRNLLWYRNQTNRYSFSHDKLREALLKRLRQAEIEDFHRRTAEYLLFRLPVADSEVAYHFDAAGSHESALPYAYRAAEKALAQNKFSDAKTQYQIALRSSNYASVPQRYQIRTGLGKVLMERGEYDAVEQHFRAAANYASDDLERAQALGNLAEIQRRRGDIGDAIKSYRQSLEILNFRLPSTRSGVFFACIMEAAVQVLHTCLPRQFVGRLNRLPDEREGLALRLFSGLTHANTNGSNAFQGFLSHLRSVNLAERFLPSPELSVLYMEHIDAMSFLGMMRRAEKYAERARSIDADELPGVRDGLISHYLSIGYYCGGYYDKAIEHGKRSIQLLERVGDYWKIHMARYQLAAALYQKGYYREALTEAKRNYESGIEKGDFQASGIILDVWARVSPGDIPNEILDLEFSRNRDDAQGTGQLLLAKTANLIGQKKLDEAIAAGEQGKKLLFERLLTTPYAYAIFTWSVVALRMKADTLSSLESTRRNQLLSRAFRTAILGLTHATLQPIEKPRLLRETAMVCMMQGRDWLARIFLRRSIAWAKHQKTEFDYAESLRVLAELDLRRGHHNAKASLDEANSKLTHLRMVHGTQVVRYDLADSQATVSLIDQFETLLNVGRKISTALYEEDVHRQTREAAAKLLRCEDCIVVSFEKNRLRIIDGPNLRFDQEFARKCIRENRTIVKSSDGGDSILCAPISVLGRTQACLMASHSLIRNMFGPNEQRLADFIATLAGASLENALGYSQLQELNTTLEDRVAERTQAAESRARELAISNEELEKTATELRQTEEQLRSAVAEANAASEAKSRFLATMSHEIRTPMNGILGMAELALATKLDATQAKYLNVVKQSGQTLLELLNEILDMSKIEAGKIEIESIAFELREVVESAVQLFSPAAHSKDLSILCDISPTLPLRVHGDPHRIRQIVVNLIGNAIKFTSKGEVCVSVHETADEMVQIAVRDSGIGIAPEKQQAVFEAFQQEDSSTTRKYGGTGLGLSICQQLAELMGGSIQLTSVQGTGSTFSLHLPLEAAGVQTQSDQGDETLRHRTALVVSPQSSQQSATLNLLTCLGIQAIAVDSVDDLEADMVESVDLLILDDPDIESIALAKTWTSKIAGMVRNGTELEDCEVLLKPLHLEEVRQTLHAVLDSPATPKKAISAVEQALPPAEMSTVQLGSSARDPQTEVSDAASQGPRVLVADDCEVNQQVAKGLLEMEGFVVETVGTGLEAVNATREKQYDIILMDVEMPEMDGMEATREIRKTSEIPILALSAHAVKDLEVRCGDVGFSGFVSKPVIPTDLISRIQSALLQSV